MFYILLHSVGISFCSSGCLHLTPIHGFIQLRPSFEYLNKADTNKKATATASMGKNLLKLHNHMSM